MSEDTIQSNSAPETSGDSTLPQTETPLPPNVAAFPEQPEPTAEEKAVAQREQDFAELEQISSHLQATKAALALKALTPTGQTERHALFDRIINEDGPLIVAGQPVWNIQDKPESTPIAAAETAATA